MGIKKKELSVSYSIIAGLVILTMIISMVGTFLVLDGADNVKSRLRVVSDSTKAKLSFTVKNPVVVEPQTVEDKAQIKLTIQKPI